MISPSENAEPAEASPDIQRSIVAEGMFDIADIALDGGPHWLAALAAYLAVVHLLRTLAVRGLLR